MESKRPEVKKLSMTSTKQEMLDAYHAVLKQLEEKNEAELKPEKKIEEKKQKEAVQVALAASSDGASRQIADLKIEIGKMLTQISDKLDDEVSRFKKIEEAVRFKEKELEELYGIEKSALSLAALIEAQARKQEEFDTKMAADKEQLSQDMENTRLRWAEEKQAREAAAKEWDAVEKKRRDREREEFDYGFKRDQKLAIEALEDQKARLEKEIATKRAEVEQGLEAREKMVSEKESELQDLQKRAGGFPKELESAVAKAVKETTERLTAEAKGREDLLTKEFDGERNVLKTRVEALDKTLKDQHDQIARLSAQLDKAYQKIEDVAVKTIEGAANTQSLANLQQLLSDQLRKQTQER
jgi:predicted  nucleic acid-binding Zn-ribbon protein